MTSHEFELAVCDRLVVGRSGRHVRRRVADNLQHAGVPL
jgi:hypothetical protein